MALSSQYCVGQQQHVLVWGRGGVKLRAIMPRDRYGRYSRGRKNKGNRCNSGTIIVCLQTLFINQISPSFLPIPCSAPAASPPAGTSLMGQFIKTFKELAGYYDFLKAQVGGWAWHIIVIMGCWCEAGEEAGKGLAEWEGVGVREAVVEDKTSSKLVAPLSWWLGWVI